MKISVHKKKFIFIFQLVLLLFFISFPVSALAPLVEDNFDLNAPPVPKISDVVQFEMTQFDEKSHKEFTITMTTKNDFKIYADNLKFKIVPKASFPYPLQYRSSVPAADYHDPFAKKIKKIFQNGTLFYLKSKAPFSSEDILEIRVQSCSHSICLMPAVLTLQVLQGSLSVEPKQSINYEKSFGTKAPEKNSILQNMVSPKQTPPESQISELKESSSSDVNFSFFTDNIAYKIENALKSHSFIIFPALFLAGLLMNLTPCVYPMIPITLNVMAQFGGGASTEGEERKKRKKIIPFIYVAGMVFTYSLLGVFAGMTGNIFGSQLASPAFTVFVAIIMLLLGFSMLGFFNFNIIQNLANKIPYAKNSPYIAVATMGAVSGLIAAPCTGPVLSSILVLIANTKNPLSGFTYMFSFALGFGFPYAILGLIEQNFLRLPRFPRIIQFIKIFFASLMFALAFYYVRDLLQNVSLLKVLYFQPGYFFILVFFFIALICTLFSIKKGVVGKVAIMGLTISMALLALWLTLLVTNTFVRADFRNFESGDLSQFSKIHWQRNYKEALHLSEKTQKPLFVDIWAQWCTACLEMESTVWQNDKLASYLNENYIPVKLDYTQPTDDIQTLVNNWGVVGLPAMALFRDARSFKLKPVALIQGNTTVERILNTAQQYSH